MAKQAFERLREYRVSRELGLVEMAQLLGCSPAWVSLLERGLKPPGSNRLAQAIEDVTGISAKLWPATERKPRKRKAA